MIKVVDISTEDLVDPRQFGWVDYQEGDIIVRAKVIRSKNGKPFISLPTAFKKTTGLVEILRYEDKKLWEEKKRELLKIFRDHIGSNYFYVDTPSPS